jgi:hypothetical protein
MSRDSSESDTGREEEVIEDVNTKRVIIFAAYFGDIITILLGNLSVSLRGSCLSEQGSLLLRVLH